MNFIPPEDEGRLRAAASGVLPNGRPIVVNADGTVSVIDSDSIGSKVVFDTSNLDSTALYTSAVFDSNSNKVVIAYRDAGNSNYGTAIVGTVSGTTISFGSAAVFESASTTFISAAFDSNSNKVVIGYNDNGNSQYGTAIVGTVSGTSISFGTPVVFSSVQSIGISTSFDSNSNKVVVFFNNQSNDNGIGIVGTVSGTNISFGSPTNFTTTNPLEMLSTFDSANNKLVIIYRSGGQSDHGYSVVGTVSGTNVSFGTPVRYSAIARASVPRVSIVFDSNANKVVISFRGTSGYGNALVGTVSGTGISYGSPVVFHGSGVTWNSIIFDSSTNKVIIAFDPDNTTKITFISGTVSGTSISFGSSTADASTSGVAFSPRSLVFDSNSNKPVLAFADGAASGKGTAVVYSIGSANLTAENYVGMSGGVVSFTGSAKILGSESVFESATVSYTNAAFDSNSNKVVVAYNDGGNSSSGTAVVGTVSGSSITFGTPVVFNSGSNTAWISVDFDSNSNKIVIAYMDAGNSNYGTAIVGTVSNTSISFGSEVVFYSGSVSRMDMCFDSNSNKIVIAFADGPAGEDGTAIVGTVSGTSISFGNKQAFLTDQYEYPAMAFDSNSNKIVIAYSSYAGGDKMSAVVGTVSGTSISFGSTASILSGGYGIYSGATFDSNSNKVVITFRHAGGSNYGTAVVGTVSGTNITFGSLVVFNSATTQYNDPQFDSSSNRVVVSYLNSVTSVGSLVAGTVSGTSITFGSATAFNTGTTSYIKNTFDSNSNKVVTVYRDDGNSNYGTAVVFKPDTRTTTRGQVASGSSASVDIIGTVSTNQNALTPGQSYFVQPDGTLALTAGTPSVFAGTAISATKLLVKT